MTNIMLLKERKETLIMAIVKFNDWCKGDGFDGTFCLCIDADVKEIKELLDPCLYYEDEDYEDYDASYGEWVEERLNAEKIAFREYLPHVDLVIDW